MNPVNPDYFYHAANILMLAAYSVRDVLWLRLFAVAASLIAIPYFVLQPRTLWAPLTWCAVFVTINLLRSWHIYVERRPVKLTAEEEEVRRLVFQDLPSQKVLQVLSLGTWVTAEAGERLIERGKIPDAFSLIVRGKVRVTKDGCVLDDLGAGDIVGSASIVTGVPAEVDAVTLGPVRAVRWRVETLGNYLNANPDIRIVMQHQLARDLARKAKHLALISRGAVG